VRHGEGFHNIGIVNEDAHLTAAGWKQAHALRKHTAGISPALDVQARPAPAPRSPLALGAVPARPPARRARRRRLLPLNGCKIDMKVGSEIVA